MNPEQRHNACVDALVQRLEASGRYDRISTFIEYYEGDHIAGECDVVAETPDCALHIYEVKGNDNYKSRKHAKDQLLRAYELGNWNVAPKLIYHSPQKTRRIYPE